MKNFRFPVLFAAILLLLASCTGNTTIEGCINGAPSSSEIVLKTPDGGQYKVIATLKIDKKGEFSYKADVAKGDPQMIYVYYGNTRLATLLLSRGEKVKITSDTLGNSSITGSQESLLLAQVEKEYADFRSRFAQCSANLDSAQTEAEAAAVTKAAIDEYVAYYRSCVKYVLGHPTSLTVVPVLFQKASESLPIFSQQTDAIIFRNACDALEPQWKNSRYFKALKDETNARMQSFDLYQKMQDAGELGFPELEISDINGIKRKLSDVSAKAILLYFWSPSVPEQNRYNVEEILPLYRKYHPKGLEIYQVAIENDMALWAGNVKGQGLEWINVCDGLGIASPALNLYNVSRIPTMYLIYNGEVVDGQQTDVKSLEALLKKYLK